MNLFSKNYINTMHFPAQPDQLVWLAKDLKDQALGIRVAEHLIGSYSSK